MYSNNNHSKQINILTSSVSLKRKNSIVCNQPDKLLTVSTSEYIIMDIKNNKKKKKRYEVLLIFFITMGVYLCELKEKKKKNF